MPYPRRPRSLTQRLRRLAIRGLDRAAEFRGALGVCLVVREDRDQAVRVPGRGGEDDAAPAAVHREEADPVVPAVSRLLQVLAGVGMPGEGGDRLVDGALDVLVQLRALRQTRFGDRQAGQLQVTWSTPLLALQVPPRRGTRTRI
jgi:hypothetical protein